MERISSPQLPPPAPRRAGHTYIVLSHDNTKEARSRRGGDGGEEEKISKEALAYCYNFTYLCSEANL